MAWAIIHRRSSRKTPLQGTYWQATQVAPAANGLPKIPSQGSRRNAGAGFTRTACKLDADVHLGAARGEGLVHLDVAVVVAVRTHPHLHRIAARNMGSVSTTR